MACADSPEPQPAAGLDAGSSVDASVVADASVSADVGSQEPVDAGSSPPTIWRGPKLTFTKPAFAEPGEPEAQDRLTDQVVITRGAGNILYNIAQENSVDRTVSPMGTLWARGTTEALDDLSFQPLKAAANSRLQDVPGESFVVHLIEENIYLDVTFLSWVIGRDSGGGFSYERSTPEAN
jgi:hypothetical protein